MGGNNSTAHSALVQQCQGYLAVNGGFVLKIHGGGFQRPGVPDIFSCIHGRLIACECKTGSARLTAKQVEVRDELIAAGAIYVECRQIEMLEDALLAAGLVRFRLSQRMPLAVRVPHAAPVSRRSALALAARRAIVEGNA